MPLSYGFYFWWEVYYNYYCFFHQNVLCALSAFKIFSLSLVFRCLTLYLSCLRFITFLILDLWADTFHQLWTLLGHLFKHFFGSIFFLIYFLESDTCIFDALGCFSQLFKHFFSPFILVWIIPIHLTLNLLIVSSAFLGSCKMSWMNSIFMILYL